MSRRQAVNAVPEAGGFLKGRRRISIASHDRHPNRHAANPLASRIRDFRDLSDTICGPRRAGLDRSAADRARRDRRRRACPMRWRGRAAGTRSLPRSTCSATRPSASCAPRCPRRPAGPRSCSTSRRSGSTCSTTSRSSGRKIFSALVVAEDDHTLVVAAARPEDAIVPARELGAGAASTSSSGIALDITLARTIRLGFASAKRGDKFLVGTETIARTAYLAVVHPTAREDEARQAQRALAEDAARAIEADDELPSASTLTGDWQVSTVSTTDDHAFAERTALIAADFDRYEDETDSGGKLRALVIDHDPPGRHPARRRAREARLGMSVDVDRFARCRAADAPDIRPRVRRRRGARDRRPADVSRDQAQHAARPSVKVVVTTSVLDSGQVPDDVLQRHGADGYLEKPLDRAAPAPDHPRARRRSRTAPIRRSRSPTRSAAITRATSKRRSRDCAARSSPIRPARSCTSCSRTSCSARRAGAKPSTSTKSTVELQPHYFPALTRLAYLYFRQGLHARAVETWRRALPVCEDPALRRNIELFMRKLVADMSKGA